MKNKVMSTVGTLIYKHFVYQEEILEGNTDHEKIRQSYNMWSSWCIITAITPKHIRIELPDKAKPSEYPVSHYTDYKILKGLWVVYADYSKDIDQYYWCSNSVQAFVRKCICKAKCSGPYLLHTINLG